MGMLTFHSLNFISFSGLKFNSKRVLYIVEIGGESKGMLIGWGRGRVNLLGVPSKKHYESK